MLTTVAFYEAQTLTTAAYVAIAAIADQHIRVVGDDIQIPTLNQIVMIAGGLSSTGTDNRMRLTSPSLRERSLYQITPLSLAASNVEPMSLQTLVDLRDNPLVLVSSEQLNAEVLGTVTTEESWCIVWLSDGPIVPVVGAMFTIRCTNTTTLVAGAWTNGPLTFDEDLPRGRYQIVGMRAQSAGLVAARIVSVGAGWRPGVLGCDSVEDTGREFLRMGKMGVLAEFEDIEPPTIDFLSVSADTAQVIFFDLIQLRKGPA